MKNLFSILFLTLIFLGTPFLNGQPTQKMNKDVTSSHFSEMVRQTPLVRERSGDRTFNNGIPLSDGAAETKVGKKTAYGYLVSSASESKKGVATFDITSPGNVKLIFPEKYTYTAFAAAYANEKYYVSLFIDLWLQPIGLYEYDLETGESIKLSDWSDMTTTFSDMSYDYSTGTMYAIMSLNNNGSTPNPTSNLYAIDLVSGAYSEVASLDRYFFTLACTYKGELYGISSAGDFCKISKTGAVTVVGATGITPKYSQTMEFDHETQILYWAAQSDEVEAFYEVDYRRNGSVRKIGDFNNGAQLAGLYIPFQVADADNAPNLVSNLRATPGENGANNVMLTWKNPLINFVGAPLEELTGVKIYRNNSLVATINTEMSIGANAKWTDGEVATGITEYKVIPYNSGGNGLFTTVSTFVGRDRPGTVESLAVTSQGEDQIVVSWDQPSAGINNGWYDKTSLKYTITRNPDNVIVANNITETSFVDTVTELNSYSYVVVTSNSDGIGASILSNNITAGPPLNVPYYCNFDTEETFNTWTIEDENQDGNSWVYDWGRVLYVFNRNAANDWLLSPPIKMKAGDYKLSFDVRGRYPDSYEKMKVTVGKGASSAVQTTTVLDLTYIVNLNMETKEAIITISEDGFYNIGFNVYSIEEQGDLLVSNIKLASYCDNDLEAVVLKGSATAIEGRRNGYTLEVKNSGSLKQNAYKVELLDGNNVVLAFVNVNEELLPQQTKDVLIKFTPVTVVEMKLKGRVVLTGGDCNNDNDVTPDIRVDVISITTPKEIFIGSNNYDNQWTCAPFNLSSSRNAWSQTIYQKEEIGISGGMINQAKYLYTSSSEGNAIARIKLYMANTDKTNLVDNWINPDDFTLVYDSDTDQTFYSPGGGQIDGDFIIDLTFDIPFKYIGGNMCIMAETIGKKAASLFVCNQTTDNTTIRRTRYWSGPAGMQNTFTPTDGSTANLIPDVTVYVATGSGGILSGKVTNSDGDPLKDVEVSIAGKTSVKTDAYGEYELLSLDPNNYTVTFSKIGYIDCVKEWQVITNGEETILNTTMIDVPSFSVSGKILDADGSAVSDAQIKLTGYEALEVVSDVSGMFTFSRVHESDEYVLTVTTAVHQMFTMSLTVANSNVVIPDIKLQDKMLTVGNVRAERTANGTIDVEWFDPTKVREFRIDSGVNESNAGSLGSVYLADKAVFGTVYRESAKLYSMSWFTDSYEGPHETVNVFVFDLNEHGMPTKDILYSKMDVPNTDMQWSTFEFPELVEAPNGFMVAISYAGYVAIALDSETNVDWPFLEQRNFCCTDYNIGYFQPAENAFLNHRRNFLMRANGVLMGEDESKSLSGFDVYRLTTENLQNPDNWIKIASSISEKIYIDNEWNALGQGQYAYGVKALYSGGRSSQATISNIIDKDMETSVTLSAKTNTPTNDIAGAYVIMEHKTDKKCTYKKDFPASGEVVFPSIIKGVYVVIIVKSGYEKYSSDMDFSTNSSYTPAQITITELKSKPFNLVITDAEQQTTKILGWNYTAPIVDDFEGHEDFEIDSPGEAGWSYIDVDGLPTYGFTDYDFPTMGSCMAYVIMNPMMMEPPLNNLNFNAHEGDKYLASFGSIGGRNDDYFISPELDFAINCDVKFRFWAKSAQQSDGNEKMFVGYSTSDKNISDFTWITPSEVEVPFTWTEYNYDIPRDVKYVTIRCVSNDNFVFMVDDVFIGAETTRAVLEYEISLDGTNVGRVPSTSFTFENLTEGRHTAGVKTVYSSGISEISTIEFNVATGVNEFNDLKLGIYPNPVKNVLNIVGNYTSLIIYDSQGKAVLHQDSMKASIDVGSLSNGLYVIKANDNDYIGVYKIVIKK